MADQRVMAAKVAKDGIVSTEAKKGTFILARLNVLEDRDSGNVVLEMGDAQFTAAQADIQHGAAVPLDVLRDVAEASHDAEDVAAAQREEAPRKAKGE